jgi:hypothetical protein
MTVARYCWIVCASLFIVIAAGSEPASADTGCAAVYGGLADPHLYATMTCETMETQRIDTTHGGHHVQVDIVLRDLNANPAVTAALRSSVPAMHPVVENAVWADDQFGEVPPLIKVVVGWKPGPIQVGIVASGATLPDICVTDKRGAWNDVSCKQGPHCVVEITLNESGRGFNDAQLQEAVAHELFHCVQNFNFAEHMAHYDATHWWAEGTAEYFATLVVPAGLRRDFPPIFDSESVTQDFFSIGAPHSVGYPLGGFFAFLDGPDGLGTTPALYDLIRGLPPGGNPETQLAALRAVPRFEQTLQKFAESYASGHVRTRIPDLDEYPVHPNLGSSISLDNSLRIAFRPFQAGLEAHSMGSIHPLHPFTLTRGSALLRQGGRYRITAAPIAGVRVSVKLGDAAWVEQPNGTMADACSHDQTLIAVATTLHSDLHEGPAIQIDRTPCAPPSGVVNPCSYITADEVSAIVGSPVGGRGSFDLTGPAMPIATCHFNPKLSHKQQFKDRNDPTLEHGRLERENVRSVTIDLLARKGDPPSTETLDLKALAGLGQRGASWAPNPPFETIHGLGDEAYYGGQLAVRFDGWLLHVSVAGPDYISNSGPDDRQQEIEIARLLMSRLPLH